MPIAYFLRQMDGPFGAARALAKSLFVFIFDQSRPGGKSFPLSQEVRVDFSTGLGAASKRAMDWQRKYLSHTTQQLHEPHHGGRNTYS